MGRINRLNLADVIIVARGGGSPKSSGPLTNKNWRWPSMLQRFLSFPPSDTKPILPFRISLPMCAPPRPRQQPKWSRFPRKLPGASFRATLAHGAGHFCAFRRLQTAVKSLKSSRRPYANAAKQHHRTQKRCQNPAQTLAKTAETMLVMQRMQLANLQIRLEANDVAATLAKGYALVKIQDKLLTSKEQARLHESIDVIGQLQTKG